MKHATQREPIGTDPTDAIATQASVLASVMSERYEAYVRHEYPNIAKFPGFPGREYSAHVTPRKAFFAVDLGSSGRYLVDAHGDVWSIKAYGVPNRNLGPIATIIDSIRQLAYYR